MRSFVRPRLLPRYVAALGLVSGLGACSAASQREEVTETVDELGAIPMPKHRGVNLNGADFGAALPGRMGVDYKFPTAAEVDYYQSKGMDTFRVGFAWERLQPSAMAEFDATYFAELDKLVGYATAKGAKVVLNPQNFARYYGKPVGSPEVPNGVFEDLWARLAAKYRANPKVFFGLVNEPHDMSTEQWAYAANAAISAIRAANAKNLVLVPGNGWSGAYSWYDTWYGTPNAVAMQGIVDPADNIAFEVHQYLDADSSGGSETCVSTTVGSKRLAVFVKWLRDHNQKGFIGEFAGARNETCYAAVTDMLKYVSANGDVLIGWTWWGGGPWWGEYRYTLEPTSIPHGTGPIEGAAVDDPDAGSTAHADAGVFGLDGGARFVPFDGGETHDGGATLVDRPQMRLLVPFLGKQPPK